VTGNSPIRLWLENYIQFHCDDCGSNDGFRSRRRTFSERFILPVLLLRPVRCAECFRRDYRLLLVPVKLRLADVSRPLPAPAANPGRSVA
jgi:hypothetical protein